MPFRGPGGVLAFRALDLARSTDFSMVSEGVLFGAVALQPERAGRDRSTKPAGPPSPRQLLQSGESKNPSIDVGRAET